MGSFGSKLSDWWNNVVISATYNPAADALKQAFRTNVSQNLGGLSATVSNIGGGFGSAIRSIPGVGTPIMDALSALQQESEQLLEDAKHMTPDQIATANDDLKAKAAKLEADAKAAGETVEQYQKEHGIVVEKPFSISDFMTTIFQNTLYIFLFFLILTLALLGSSLASNAVVNKAFGYRLYYMVYGFLLFPLPIVMGMYRKFYKHEKLFYAIWAPLHTSFTSNKILNVILFPFIYTPPGVVASQYTNNIVATYPTHHTPPIVRQSTFNEQQLGSQV